MVKDIVGGEGARIVWWRLAGVIIPWVTVLGMFMMAHEKYIRMELVVSDFPRLATEVSKLTERVNIIEAFARSIDERTRETAASLNDINKVLLRMAVKSEN